MKTKTLNPWPLAIVAFFVIAIVFIACFVGLSIRQREDLVATNYYDNEIRFQERLDAMNRSQTLASQVLVVFDPTKKQIVLSIPGQESKSLVGSVHLYRPSDARLDREIPLALNANGKQHLDASKLREGLWKVRAQWNAGGEEFTLEQPVIVTVQ